MDEHERLRALERQLDDLKARMPAHTVRAAMMMEMEDLEEEIATLRARLEEGSIPDEGAAGHWPLQPRRVR